MDCKLTEKEYKDLIIKIAIKISPVLVVKELEHLSTGENIAIKAGQIADAVNLVLEGKL